MILVEVADLVLNFATEQGIHMTECLYITSDPAYKQILEHWNQAVKEKSMLQHFPMVLWQESV